MVETVGGHPFSRHLLGVQVLEERGSHPFHGEAVALGERILLKIVFHALNRTWDDDESFYTLSSGESYRSLLSLSDDEDDGASDPGGDRLLGFLGQTEVFRDSLEPVESPPRVPRGRASFPPGSRGQVTAEDRAGDEDRPSRVPEVQPGGTLDKVPFSHVPEHQHGGLLDQENSQWGCTSVT